MEILKIFLTSVFSIAVLFALTKLMGKRQISQMSMFDYVNGITIGSIAAEMATALDSSFWNALIAMVIYSLSVILVSWLSLKSFKIRSIIEGRPCILFKNNAFYYQNLKKSHIDINEFIMQCRNQGYFDISKIDSVMLEPNGRLSILPLSTERPVSPKDLNIQPPVEHIPIIVIEDGKILDNNLKSTGNNIVWLEKQLKKQSLSAKDVLLAYVSSDNILYAFKKIEENHTHSEN